ncbi:hypothetical protein PR048_015871 [Dryococelus australis]|uniref:Uncharacterized protein n=1 Tax=Dryococelus australis TaxID=614101 RepID=A0ABQ9HI75_9NEOP|nr:hypothetical protein PR048_015871 [Dryococelus australis]
MIGSLLKVPYLVYEGVLTLAILASKEIWHLIVADSYASCRSATCNLVEYKHCINTRAAVSHINVPYTYKETCFHRDFVNDPNNAQIHTIRKFSSYGGQAYKSCKSWFWSFVHECEKGNVPLCKTEEH